jgi:trehalose 6-phosphate synthase
MVAIATLAAVPLTEQILKNWFRDDVEMRANLVINSIEDGLARLIGRPTTTPLKEFLAKVTNDERLLAVALCKPDGSVFFKTERTPAELVCPKDMPAEPEFFFMRAATGRLHIAWYPLVRPGRDPVAVAIVHDLSFIDRRRRHVRDYLIVFLGLSVIAIITLGTLAAGFLLRTWMRRLVVDIRERRYRDDTSKAAGPFDPVLQQVRQTLRDVEQHYSQEADFRENWTPEALKHIAQTHLDNAQMLVVSNREPYIHTRKPEGIVVEYPASGMVTALEPVVRACSGVWIAHGSGTADREVVDRQDHIQVPPDDPTYTLRRVWLSEAEEQGYYYGFANEGLWPLCHLAYVRPAFRPSDWAHYQAANARFADAVASECREERPLILVQDFHLALLPGLLRERLPNATVALFWHIPWPNPETFGVCPWRRELVQSMLQADIVGFHTRYHCQNFLETVDRFVESHIDQERSTVTVRDHTCHVSPYPISIEWPPRWLKDVPAPAECRSEVFRQYRLPPDARLGVGVERWDFTKGIIERCLALERLLETEPEWRGKLFFLQIAAPSRSKLPAYRELQHATIETVDRINTRFSADGYRPIVLVGEHRNPVQVYTLYRACDFCLVNSLHDGMNLVAKEFVAARDDEDGVLILSDFAGASRELHEALIVNPYDLEETVRALSQALRMSREERRERMRIMRQILKEWNVFRWAGRMLLDAARIRQRQRLQQLAGRSAGASAAVRQP